MANQNLEITGVRMKLASPERIRELSSGEVKRAETINYRSLRPEKDGLFCERIFGPMKSYECACGKYKRSGPKFKGVVCDRCGVEVTDNRVRRERKGHIELAAPVVHIWYLKGLPSRLSLLLGASTKDLEKVIYFAPTRRREKVYKVVSEGKRADIAGRGTRLTAAEERIHRFYDPKFKAEEAYRILKVEELPIDKGDVLPANQVARLRIDYGEHLFKVEPAYRLYKETENEPGRATLVAESMLETNMQFDPELKSEPAEINGQVAYIVTSVEHLPFAKDDVISETELREYEEKYPKRFESMEERVTIEEPCYLVVEKGSSMFETSDIVLENEVEVCKAYDKNFEAGIGAEGVYELLDRLDLADMVVSLREEIAECSGQKKRKLVKRLQVVEDFRKSDSLPKWMVLSVLPVIPPDLRPMVQLDGGRFATSDLNDLYRRVINRNNRLLKLMDLRAPEIIIRNEKRMLQESVDALIDNGRRGKAVLGAGSRPLKSLTDLLRGKKGRFRQNLLGKRVDYSGRSVIAIGPHLKLYQCGLPKQMALELFKPFVMHKLVEGGLAPNVKSARRYIEKGNDEVWAILENIIKDHPVMLNRAPTLHRLGIQAFEPVLIEGKAIRLHPLVCTAFNADFDGDQMAVHLPLSLEAQTEARVLMLASNNLLSPASGKPIVTPSQDIILGSYFLTSMMDGMKGEGLHFNTGEEVLAALDHEIVTIKTKIYLKPSPEWDCETTEDGKWILTSPGRVLFNEALHPKLRFFNQVIKKSTMSSMLDIAYDKVGQTGMVEMLDTIKELGYHWSTKSGISLGIHDIIVPEAKRRILDDEIIEQEQDLSEQFDFGVLTEDEYMREKDILWSYAGNKIADEVIKVMDVNNPLRIMVDSGARGSKGQVSQMAGIRGLMTDPSGKIITYPITANFKEGLNTLEYFISTHGARKGLADTALRTAKSGYLTRRLVDVAQDLIITEEDCDTHAGIEIRPLLQSDGKPIIRISERITGRVALEDTYDEKTGELLLARGEEITKEKAEYVESLGITSVWVRSPTTCGCKHGICRTCYGKDLATRKQVSIGESVGVIAAQSIGEPGTQLTMRTFHSGGVRQISGEDITQGLPRIEQLFEVRTPKKTAILAEVSGKLIEIRDLDGKKKLIVETIDEDGNKKNVTLNIPASQSLLTKIEKGMDLIKGEPLTEGYVDPKQLLEVKGLEEVQHYLLDGIQEVYRSQGVTINDKHIETILRKVAPVNRVRIVDEGNSTFVAGELVWKDELERVVKDMKAKNEKSLAESYEFLNNYKIIKLPNITKQADVPDSISEESLSSLIKSGGPQGKIVVVDDKGEVEIILGEASFRKTVVGQELLENIIDPTTNEVIIEAGKKLTSSDLTKISSLPYAPINVMDISLFENLERSVWFASDVDVNGETVIKADTKLTDVEVDILRNNDVCKIRLWKSPENFDIIDAMHHSLINITGRTILQILGKDGEPVDSDNTVIDGAIVRAIIDGDIYAIETDDGIITRAKVVEDVLNTKLYGKILLEDVFDEEGNIVAVSGTEVTRDNAVMLSKHIGSSIVIRTKQAGYEYRQIKARYAFIRRLKEEPQSMPVVHGITKAALATDSFLSAASFQQTAQVLAGAAVRGDVDNLVGLKENVIIGLLIPAGTGIHRNEEVIINETAPTIETPGVEMSEKDVE